MKRRSLLVASLLFAMIGFSLGSSAPLAVGAPAPAVSGVADDGSTVDLAAVYSQNPYTLVYFYPKADTPGCTKQGCSLRDAYEELTERGVAVFGVSYDSVANQKAFREKYQLPFHLIADTDKKVATAFGANGLLMASRSAYLIHEGKVVYADHKGSTTEQAADILKFLAR